MFEQGSNSPPNDVYPVSVDAVRETLAFFETNIPGSKHTAVAREIDKSSPDLLGRFSELVESWDLAETAQSDIKNGFLITYKLLQIQAEFEGSSLPTVQEAIIDTYLVDLAQSGELDTGRYFNTRIDELELDDPIFTAYLRVCEGAMGEPSEQDADRLTFFSVGSILLHDMLYKQAASDQMHRQFKM